MKKITYSLLLLTAILMLFAASCSKDGAVGPKGDTGDKGPNGAVGPAGPAGSVIYSGTTVPAASKGIAGDFYLNTSTGLLYGPKTASGWGNGLSLKGAIGATGAAGSTTLSGTGLPATNLGKNGDYYLDKTNYLLYGPKTGSGWGVPLNLRGPQGNANVKVDSFTVETTEWNKSDFGTIYVLQNTMYSTKYVDHNNPLITANLLNTGLVFVYFKFIQNSENPWKPVPYSYLDGYKGFAYNWAYEPFVGGIRLHFYLSRITVDPPSIREYQVSPSKFKIVTVSGATASALQQNHINMNNYKEVSKFLNIQ
jgi:hypothetical protein